MPFTTHNKTQCPKCKWNRDNNKCWLNENLSGYIEVRTYNNLCDEYREIE